ncbi:L-seryl-tRNA(Sec) selenium transferase [Pelagibaculum spongiae]|uniref:L-seryl-tRNA(Sec) selenium transferase n=1 Tax=Pelagibaculum spongiae TaxID=2080658 RepID=A0A2V1H5X7_9GAMM|nr:L-seryl-tRNA(Sec) selenium transferase [Pelagibaculum spongiae]PVZ71832.1 L-seryl-tRNA(Sec) selenium transferase [Pelagibaculum spongiae]
MTEQSNDSLSRRLPQVEQILQAPSLQKHIDQLSRPLVTALVRQALAKIRASETFRSEGVTEKAVWKAIHHICDDQLQQRHQRVINATGTVIHTNLGRSPIDPDIWDAVKAANTGYCNLEIKLNDGKRGQRKGIIPQLLTALTSAEDSTVVNNNASAIYLLLSELASGKEVIVSRGEQIQIGGGFRIPDILQQSGAILVEVGTTNITTADDYIDAVTENTAMVLMVHRSNFAIRGFTESPSIKEVADRLPKHVLLAMDQGCGMTTETFTDEPQVSSYLKSGADLVCFSGDKIIGGPQAGIISGKRPLIKRIEKHPLMRAFRPCRMVYSMLEELMIQKLNKKQAGSGIAEATVNWVDQAQQKGAQLAENLNALLADQPKRSVELFQDQMMVGGGTTPDEYFPSWALELKLNQRPDKLLETMRCWPTPVIGTIRDGRVILNMATILPQDWSVLEQQLSNYLQS